MGGGAVTQFYDTLSWHRSDELLITCSHLDISITEREGTHDEIVPLSKQYLTRQTQIK